MDDINFVKTHYKNVAEKYREIKDPTQTDIPLFQTWMQTVIRVLELGCGSGFPIGKTLLEQGIDYTGIDLSPEQIRLAHQEYPHWKEHFIEAEMLEFVRGQPDNSYDGIVSMFSIRHLPRIHHVELFTNIHRILQPQGLFLVDHPRYAEDGRSSWFEGNPMYWSSFSYQWQKLTLQELGFELIEEFEDVKLFDGEEERTQFALYKAV